MQNKKYRYVILGGGVVAGYAAQEFGNLGVQPGELAIVSADSTLPYERPSLSKDFLAGESQRTDILINSEHFYRDHGIDVMLNTLVEQADLANRRLITAQGESIEFDKLLIATGSSPRTLDTPGADHSRVLYLRSLDDARQIRRRYDAIEHAVVVGGGYIGMEVAAVLAAQDIKTGMIFHGDHLMHRMFTAELAEFFGNYYHKRGVQLHSNDEPERFSLDAEVPGVVLRNSAAYLPADIAIVGIGVVPNTELFANSGLDIDKDDGILVNGYLESSIEGVYAAGDIASYPDAFYRSRRRVEHWQNAVDQGQHAARVMCGRHDVFKSVPYFFSDEFDLSWEFWGDPNGADEVITRGNFDEQSIGVWWVRDHNLTAAFLMNRPDAERDIAQHFVGRELQFAENMLEDANKLAFREVNN
jgi:NADPH-dependent 2,4-dienoyl-CoA reductase/sulfur reductase-like enzyme